MNVENMYTTYIFHDVASLTNETKYQVSITLLRESEKAAITIPAIPAPIPTIPIK